MDTVSSYHCNPCEVRIRCNPYARTSVRHRPWLFARRNPQTYISTMHVHRPIWTDGTGVRGCEMVICPDVPGKFKVYVMQARVQRETVHRNTLQCLRYTHAVQLIGTPAVELIDGRLPFIIVRKDVRELRSIVRANVVTRERRSPDMVEPLDQDSDSPISTAT